MIIVFYDLVYRFLVFQFLKIKLPTNISYENRCKYLHTISKLNPTTCLKTIYTTTSWDLSKICQAGSTFKNQCIPSHQQAKKEKVT